jgi:hypothetical protein
MEEEAYLCGVGGDIVYLKNFRTNILKSYEHKLFFKIIFARMFTLFISVIKN